ncbi:protein of unknown function [Nitrosotalea devaniterrae]|uniref:DUF4062 domain-containing protein n=1 Tax=Nitrosotalea devaniterrae TaxID=1078905 RepID=A0A128A3Y6_9ARCH|nr:protein of unknown function [Candidatus Nitrosotalea devanaterra]
MSDKLRIFVSGNESELDDERAIAFKVIKSLGYDPIGSENRTASSDPIESEYIGEVESSDFYIGIFGKEDSDATRKEFEKARSTGKCTLVFQKNVHSTERKPELEEFLNKIKDSKTGVVYLKYNNSADLQTAIVHSLSYYVTKKFREAQKLQREENKKANELRIESEKKIDDIKSKLSRLVKMGKFSIGTQLSEQFGKAEFIYFKFPSSCEKSKTHLVSAKIKGYTKNGFLDLAIKDPNGNYLWFPDPQSYDATYDNGKLTLENDDEYEARWEFRIPPIDYGSGKFTAIMGLYENNFTDRRCVNYEEQEFTVI